MSLPLHGVVMIVRLVDGSEPPDLNDEVTWYEVAFEGVTRFEFSDVDANPWTTTELTEIVMRKLADKKTEYVFELTANADALTIVCEEARVTLLRKDAAW